jgi:phosphatidylglycerol---prolipoprotein diacylglyceryl transferase
MSILSPVISYPDIDPIAIDLGMIKIRWYGISYVVGILIAWWLLKRRTRAFRTDWSAEQVSDLMFYGVIGVIVGGRLGSMLFYNLPYFLSHPLDVFKIWEGGMSFHGGLIGVLVAIWLFARHTGRTFFNVSDFLAPVVPVGLGCGRIGNFINGELWGLPTALPWGMIFPDPRAGGIARHPSPIYECLLEGVVLFIVLWWFSSRPRPARSVSGLFLLLYGVFRFAVEFVREPDAQLGYLAGGWLTMGQVLCVPMVAMGAYWLWRARRGEAAA